jgi:hypothetical protein
MRKHLGTVLAVAGMIAVPALAQAQARGGAMAMPMPKHEFGVDIAAFLNSPSGGTSGLVIQTPVDVRIGFVSASKMSWETRFNFSLSTAGSTTYNFDPGVNVLMKMGNGTMMNNTYWTVGADASIAGSTPSGVVPAINGGIGIRRPWGSAAWRLEAGVRYLFQNTSLGVPNTLQIGVRAGVSLWH